METQAITTTTWVIDPMHSEVHFKVKHLTVSTVSGQFNQFEGELIKIGDDFNGAEISFLADVNSISTGNKQRDTHLKSAEFFDVERYPKLTFASTSMTLINYETYILTGDLSIHGKTNVVTLLAEYGGQMQDFYGSTKAGFDITGAISEKTLGHTETALLRPGAWS